MQFAFETFGGMDLGLVLRHIGELAVDRQVVAQWRIVRQARHAAGGDAEALDGLDVVAVLAAERACRFRSGAANGSKPALVQSRRIALKVAMISGVSNCSV